MSVIASIAAHRKPIRSKSEVDRVLRTTTRSEFSGRLVACLILSIIVVPSASAGAPESIPDATNLSAQPSVDRHRQTTQLDPSARLLSGGGASEYWTLYIELDSGLRMTQQFLISNAGPGNHNAVAVGHLVEEGREPYRYTNGRRRARWRLSEDRLFLDIGSSHLDLHRPVGELRITKDDIEIHLFFAFAESDVAEPVPSEVLPENYRVDVLAVAAKTEGTVQAPWMAQPIAARGRTWLTHTWTQSDEAKLLDRRIEIFGGKDEASFYMLQLLKRGSFQRSWLLQTVAEGGNVESTINIPTQWADEFTGAEQHVKRRYAVPDRFRFSQGPNSGLITLSLNWLRFDPLSVLPQPFRWYVGRKSKPLHIWADAQIEVRLYQAQETPPPLDTGETESGENPLNSGLTSINSKGEIEAEATIRSMTGVASIIFMNPSKRR